MQFFLTNLSQLAVSSFLGLPWETTLEKIALMTVAESCESRLKLFEQSSKLINSCTYPSPAVLTKELLNTNFSVAVFLKPRYLELECDKTGL